MGCDSSWTHSHHIYSTGHLEEVCERVERELLPAKSALSKQLSRRSHTVLTITFYWPNISTLPHLAAKDWWDMYYFSRTGLSSKTGSLLLRRRDWIWIGDQHSLPKIQCDTEKVITSHLGGKRKIQRENDFYTRPSLSWFKITRLLSHWTTSPESRRSVLIVICNLW